MVRATDMQSLHKQGIVSVISLRKTMSTLPRPSIRTISDAGACQNLMCTPNMSRRLSESFTVSSRSRLRTPRKLKLGSMNVGGITIPSGSGSAALGVNASCMADPGSRLEDDAGDGSGGTVTP